jgi:SAM-dependent methyltransferase
MSSRKSVELFSNRVDDYVRFRPGYPLALVSWLQSEIGVASSWQVVDVGAGTGISSQLFLAAGQTVTAVEPNDAMRKASEKILRDYTAFRAIQGTAEATTLPDGVADLIVSAQAFHWFNHDSVRHEWCRILKPGGFVAIFWNTRRLGGTAFLEGYEAILRRYCADYQSVAEKYPDDEYMRRWFGSGFRAMAKFENLQRLDFPGVLGRLMSSSYAPKVDHPAHKPMVEALGKLLVKPPKAGGLSWFMTRGFSLVLCNFAKVELCGQRLET